MNLSEITNEEWPNFYAEVMVEDANRKALARAREAAELAAQEYAQAVKDKPPVVVDDSNTALVVGPGEHIIDMDSIEWENSSGTWLAPAVAGPAVYPIGWLRVTPLEEPVDAWYPNAHEYIVDDLVMYNDTTYKVLQAHTSQADWTPDVAVSLYTKIQ